MTPSVEVLTVTTRHGDARAHLWHVAEPAGGGLRGAVVLGHGAGGGVGGPDLVTAARTAVNLGLAVVLLEQPYRVEGRRTPPRAPVLDAAWTDVLEDLSATRLGGLPVVVGGRSSGARVACRTAAATGAVGVLCLAFPLRPVARAGRPQPASRLPELDAVGVPTLVVQGERDPFGVPPAGPDRRVATVSGDHSLRTDGAAVAAATGDWLTSLPALVPADRRI